MASVGTLLWVNKNAKSTSLSHSQNHERIQVFSQAQRTSRRGKRNAASKDGYLDRSKSARQAGSSISQRSRCSPSGIIVTARSNGSCSHLPSVRQRTKSRKIEAEDYIIEPVLALDPSCTAMEARSIEFFIRVSIGKIITIQQDRSFWSSAVPRLARCHAAFRHLVAAIASTHELLYSADADALNVFALTQCNKAIKCLRSSQDWPPELLLISCILVSAYNLLRCDLDRAEKSIESGLELATKDADKDWAGSGGETAAFHQILAQLGRQHGFKLWAPDITFQFERSKAAEDCIEIDTDCVKGPFVDPRQALDAYRAFMLKVVARLMRNVARGAYIDPNCLMAQDIMRQFSMFSFHWDLLHRQISPHDEDGAMELKQIKIGFYLAFLMFHTKLVAPSEVPFDTFPIVVDNILQLADEAVAARENGRPVIYLDKIVNGAVFSLGLCTQNPVYGRKAVAILQSQANYKDGLTNWVRGLVVKSIMRLDHLSLSWWNGRSSAAGTQMVLNGLRCQNDCNDIWVEFRCSWTAMTHGAAVPINWSSWAGPRPTASEVDIRLQGIMAAYRTYGKPPSSEAPLGYVVEMLHRGRRVPVAWEPA